MAKRQSLKVPGITHGPNPIPSGVRIGGLLFSGGISGQDPAPTRSAGGEQAELAFQNLACLLSRRRQHPRHRPRRVYLGTLHHGLSTASG
jgi:hypothetical protein